MLPISKTFKRIMDNNTYNYLIDNNFNVTKSVRF